MMHHWLSRNRKQRLWNIQRQWPKSSTCGSLNKQCLKQNQNHNHSDTRNYEGCNRETHNLTNSFKINRDFTVVCCWEESERRTKANIFSGYLWLDHRPWSQPPLSPPLSSPFPKRTDPENFEFLTPTCRTAESQFRQKDLSFSELWKKISSENLEEKKRWSFWEDLIETVTGKLWLSRSKKL